MPAVATNAEDYSCLLHWLQVVQLLEDFSMVHFTTLDISDEESIEALLQSIDLAIQARGGGGRGRRGLHLACCAGLAHIPYLPAPALCSTGRTRK